jgi:hypothetical protein
LPLAASIVIILVPDSRPNQIQVRVNSTPKKNKKRGCKIYFTSLLMLHVPTTISWTSRR